MVIHSGTSDRRVQYSRVGLEVKIYDTPAGGIRASQCTFFSMIYIDDQTAVRRIIRTHQNIGTNT